MALMSSHTCLSRAVDTVQCDSGFAMEIKGFEHGMTILRAGSSTAELCRNRLLSCTGNTLLLI